MQILVASYFPFFFPRNMFSQRLNLNRATVTFCRRTVEKTSIQYRLIEGTFVWYTIRDRMVVRDNLHRRPLTS